MKARGELRKHKNFKDSMKKLSIASERFLYKVPVDEINILLKIVSKLLEHNPSTQDLLPQLFQQLDDGHTLDISGMKETYTQQKLFKIFKIMRMRTSKTNQLEFTKKTEKDIHKFSFVRFINYAIEFAQSQQEEEAEEEEGS